MNLSNKKYLYVNGSSISAGGGFESYEHRQDVRDVYSHNQYLLPDTQIECSYPYHISTQLNLELINDSKSGSGIDRLIRTTMDWVESNPAKLNETIFIFEIQLGIRLDWYVNEWKNYGILNASKNYDDEYQFTLVKNWYYDNKLEQEDWNQKYKSNIDEYFKNFFDDNEQYLDNIRQIVMFVSYLNGLGIEYLVSTPDGLPNFYENYLNKIIPYKSNLRNLFDNNIWKYCDINQMLILHELAGQNSDNHIGYIGNKKLAYQISNFIKNETKYEITNLKIYNSNSTIGFLKKLLETTHINLLIETDVSKSDIILLSGCDLPLNGDDFYKEIESQKYLKKYALTKKFLIVYYHEKMQTDILSYKLDYINKKLGIPKSNIIYIESSIFDNVLVNKIPLELKIRNYNAFGYIRNYIESKRFRTKKLSVLSNKGSLLRLLTLDSLIYYYENIEKLKNENIISYRTIDGIDSLLHNNDEFKNDKSLFHNIKLPWIIDCDLDVSNANSVSLTMDYYEDSIFSIINETETEVFPYPKTKILNLQFSEKTLIPLLSGNLPFIIHDGLIYKKLEEIGFNFGYLKEIFDIDYKVNSLIENLNSIELIVKFIRNKSIEELNQIREKNMKYIDNNLKIINQLFKGDFTENEIEFFNSLINN